MSWVILIAVVAGVIILERQLDKRDRRVEDIQDEIDSIKEFIGLTPEAEETVHQHRIDMAMIKLDNQSDE